MPFDASNATPVTSQFDAANATPVQTPPPPPSLATRGARAVQNLFGGVAEPVAQMAAGAALTPIAGLVGAGADVAHSLGANVDPAAVVHKIQGLAYTPHTPAGKAVSHAIGSVTGLIPEGANAVGERVTDATGSPAAGTIANTALQGLGMWATGKIPGLASSEPVLNAGRYVGDMLPGGANRAATRLINQYAGTEGDVAGTQATLQAHLDAQDALSKAGASGALQPKYTPTAAQVAGNTGLATLDRTLRTQGNDVARPLAAADEANRGTTLDILRGISGTPEQRLRAATARDFRARTAYDDALQNPEHFVQPPKPGDPAFEAELAAKSGLPNSDGTPSTNDPNAPASGLSPVGVRLQEVLQRPAMKTAMDNAGTIAANLGKKIDARNLIDQLHYAKMDLDTQIANAKGPAQAGILDTKHTLLGVMDDLSPAYAQARASFRVDSAPINRMQVGEALRQKYLSALQEASGTGSRPSMLLDALRRDDGDTIAAHATDFGGATLDNTLRPQDLEGLDAIRTQLGREAYAQNARRGVGSNTAENQANQATMDSIGDIRSAVGDLGHLGVGVHNPLASLALGLRGASVRQAAQSRLASVMADPAATLNALDPNYFYKTPDKVMVPAVAGAVAGENGAQDHATGGVIHPTVWNLTTKTHN